MHAGHAELGEGEVRAAGPTPAGGGQAWRHQPHPCTGMHACT